MPEQENRPVGGGLAASLPAELAAELKESSFASGAVIFEEGDNGDRLYLVAAGEVRIEKKLDQSGGKTKPLAVCFEGDFFGEMALLEGQKRFARAVAQTDVRLLELPSEGFARLSRSTPEAAMKFFLQLARGMSVKLRDTSDQLLTVYAMSRLLLEGHRGEKEFLARLATELNGSMGEGWSCSAYHYNVFNDELEPSGAAPELQAAAEDKWLDASSFVAVLAGEKRPAGFLLFKKSGQQPSPREKATRALSFSTIGRQAASMLANIRHEVEENLRKKLQTSREGIF